MDDIFIRSFLLYLMNIITSLQVYYSNWDTLYVISTNTRIFCEGMYSNSICWPSEQWTTLYEFKIMNLYFEKFEISILKENKMISIWNWTCTSTLNGCKNFIYHDHAKILPQSYGNNIILILIKTWRSKILQICWKILKFVCCIFTFFSKRSFLR